MGSCECAFDSWSYEAEYVRSSKRNWKCIECKAVIPAGTKHRVLAGIDDEGKVQVARFCADCDRVYRDFTTNYGYCIPVGTLWDFIQELEEEALNE